MKRIYLLILLVLSNYCFVIAFDNAKVYFKDGTIKTINFSSIEVYPKEDKKVIYLSKELRSIIITINSIVNDEKQNNETLFVYPNPTKNEINIKISNSKPGLYSFDLFSTNGTAITKTIDYLSETNELNFNYNLKTENNKLSNGTYFMIITKPNKTKAIIKFQIIENN